MIDIHSHILPGVDDGADDYEQSLKMVAEAYQQGITGIVATPHFRGRDQKRELIKTRLQKLQTKVEAAGLPVDIFPGAEITIRSDLAHRLSQDKLIFLNQGSYLLLELPFDRIPDYTEDLFYDLGVMDCRIIIAHPERCQPILENPELLLSLLDKDGVFAQLNVGSLVGKNGAPIKRLAEELVRRNMVHFLATDSHSAKPNRCVFQQAEKILKELGSDYGSQFRENARRVIENKPLDAAQPRVEKKKGWWSRFKNKLLKER